MNWKKIIFSTVLGGSMALALSVSFAGMWSLLFPYYNPLSIPGMRAMSDPLMALYYVQPFVQVLAFAIAFHFFGSTFGKMPVLKQGTHFGLIMWMLITLPSMFLVYASMDYGETFLLTTTITQLFEYTLAGMAIAWVFAKK